MDVKLLLANVAAGIIGAAIIASASIVAVALGIGPDQVPIIVAIAVILMLAGYFVLRTFMRVILSPITHQGPAQIYANQEAYKHLLVSRLKRSKEVKILTIRGARYFGDGDGWFRSDDQDPEILLTLLRHAADVKVLLCSPQAPHLDMDVDRDRRRSQAMLDTLSSLMRRLCSEYPNIQVRVYEEPPVWNLLAFDKDILYVSAYVGPRNDRIAPMYEFKEHPTSLFQGFRRHFERLWNTSQPLQQYLAKRRESHETQ